MEKRLGISLFSSSGIGDLGLHANGIDVVIGNELLPDRAELFSSNYPEAKMFQGDIWKLKDDIVNYYKSTFSTAPFIVLATPPCQGMSSNGMGKILSDIRNGIRPVFDERNRLIIPTIEIIKKLQPEWVVFENVPNMGNTVILDDDGNPINIIEYIFKELEGYVGVPTVMNTADYGIPQVRKRLITILTRTESGKEYFRKNGCFTPEVTHSEKGNSKTKKWVTLKAAIGHLPPLNAIEGENSRPDISPLYRVAILDPKKYEWIKYTPEGETAFNNQCVNPNCMFQGNKRHGTAHNEEGINKFNTDTPLYCEKCGALLPRPWAVDKKTGEKRIMKGFVSAYKRMSWDSPASTLTMNFPYVSSDNKVHPSQNRPLSIYEATILQTIDLYPYKWEVNKKVVSDNLIIESIGESVPPRLIEIVVNKIKSI
ncbi:MAG: DNA cytosine methyltransferase [Bacilli bacterium]|nr:DNA cytosine methyltransferase [Bacilli bacterium]